MKQLLITSILVLLVFFVTAQTLPRKGSLGVMIEETEDSSGVRITQIIEGGTGAAAGLKASDIVTTVDGQPCKRIPELLAVIGTWRVGHTVNFDITRNGKTKKLKGQVIGKPKETSEFGKVIYGSVAYDGGQLASILELPNGVTNPPVLFFLPGIGCGSLDYYYNQSMPIKQLTEGLVKQGIAVYRVEKPGMGDSQGTQACTEMTFKYEVEAFTTALKHLKSLPEIDSSNVFLYGHSLGGVSAPLIGAQVPVKGILCWGSVATSWYEYSLKILRDQAVHRGTDYGTIESDFRKNQPLLYNFYVNKMTPAELQAIPEYQDVWSDYFQSGSDLVYGLHHYKFVQELNDVNFPQAWKKANCHVLALYGEYDIHAIDATWAQRTSEMVNYYYPGKGSWKVIPKTEHNYSLVPSMAEHVKMRNEGLLNATYLAENFNPEVVEVVGGWIQLICQEAGGSGG